jgi:nitroreductase
MNFEDVIKERKSTRLFSSKSLEQDKIDKILNSARIAPTAKNTQPFKIYVIKSSEGLKKIDKCTLCRYKAPVVFLICGDENKSYIKDDKPMYDVDCAIVGTHMVLEATSIGVDNIWIEYFETSKVIEEFNLPNNLKPVCLLPMGYKAKLCPPSPLHKIRKSVETFTEYR